MNLPHSSEPPIAVDSAEYQIHTLLLEHLHHKEQLFRSVNTLVAQLHHTQKLLEANKSNEALLSLEQLVYYGETLTRQL